MFTFSPGLPEEFIRITIIPGLVMGRLWWVGLSTFHVMGRGPARPSPLIFQRMGRGPARSLNFSENGPRPGPVHRISKKSRPGPGHDIGDEAHETRALYGWPAFSVGRPVDLTGRATGRPMCCPVLKAKSYVLTYFFRCTCTINSCNSTVNTLFFLLDSVGYSPRATRTNNPHNFAT